MVLEQFIDRKIVLQHAFFIFFLSAIYVFIAYAVQEFYYPGQSIASVLLVAILLLPSIHHLVVVEEKIESFGSTHFLKRHRVIFKCYFGAFLGILAGYIILGLIYPESLSYQIQQLMTEHLKPELITNFIDTYTPDVITVTALFTHNLTYLLIGFLLSIFYGAGAIFLIAFNASYFAAFMIKLSQYTGSFNVGLVSLVHMIPESTGFILTAMAGASLSRAIIHEKLKGQQFRNVLRNDVKLLIFGVICILISALIETYVTATAFKVLI